MTNTNPETGIRFGTIYMNHIDPDTAQWLWDEAETHGVEALTDKHGEITYEYLNAGDTYNATMLYNVETGRFRVGCWGDIVERNPRRYG